MATRTEDGRPVKRLTIVDEYTRVWLAIDVERRLPSDDVGYQLPELFVQRDVPQHIRSDHGPEFAAKVMQHWLGRVGVQTVFLTPGSPWENGSIESFSGGGYVMDCWIGSCLIHSGRKVLMGRWRQSHDWIRPHSALGY